MLSVDGFAAKKLRTRYGPIQNAAITTIATTMTVAITRKVAIGRRFVPVEREGDAGALVDPSNEMLQFAPSHPAKQIHFGGVV